MKEQAVLKYQRKSDMARMVLNGDFRSNHQLFQGINGSRCEYSCYLLLQNVWALKLFILRGLSQGTTSNIDGQQKTPQALTTDYLTELAKHLMYTLEQRLGAAILRTIPIDFCLTVPAIWSEVAKEQTLKACKRAGLKSQSEILLVSEPVNVTVNQVTMTN